MLKRIRKSMEEKDQGFTLIELLVVMIIIGILAAIAVPVFLSQRSKAQDTAAKSDVGILGKEIATYFVDGTTTPSVLIAPIPVTAASRYSVNGVDIGKVSSNNRLLKSDGTLATTAADVNGSWTSIAWCIAVKNTNSGGIFKYSAQNGLETGNCQTSILP